MSSIKVRNTTPQPTQSSLLNEGFPYKLNIWHSSTKLPYQCVFTINCQSINIIMHIRKHNSLALFSSLSMSGSLHICRIVSRMYVSQPCY